MRIPVLFPKIFDFPFTYKNETNESLNAGDFVKAPFGNTEITGVGSGNQTFCSNHAYAPPELSTESVTEVVAFVCPLVICAEVI